MKRSPLYKFLSRLDDEGIYYKLERVRDETVMVEVAVPGERWEVEFFEDGTIDVERFRSDGRISDGSALKELFKKHGSKPRR